MPKGTVSACSIRPSRTRRRLKCPKWWQDGAAIDLGGAGSSSRARGCYITTPNGRAMRRVRRSRRSEAEKTERNPRKSKPKPKKDQSPTVKAHDNAPAALTQRVGAACARPDGYRSRAPQGSGLTRRRDQPGAPRWPDLQAKPREVAQRLVAALDLPAGIRAQV